MLTLNKNFWTGGGSVADENTVFLMNFNSTPFVDESSNAYALTSYNNGDTAQDTTNTMFSSTGSYQGPASAGTDQSMQNFGDGDYIGYFSSNTEPFTVEGFIYLTSNGTAYPLCAGGYGYSPNYPMWRIRVTTKIYFYWYKPTSGYTVIYDDPWNSDGSGRESMATYTWYYFCLRHDGTNQQLFCDKASRSTARVVAQQTIASMGGVDMNQNDRLVIGGRPYSDSAGSESAINSVLRGSMDSIRISNIARYTVDTSGSIDSIPMPQAELS